MFKKKRVFISIAAVVIVAAILFFAINTLTWSPPSSDWWMSFESIEEINEIRRLVNDGTESELLEFIEGTNNGENVARNREDVQRFLRIFEDLLLPSDPNWTEFIYEYSMNDLIIVYNKSCGSELSFIIPIGEMFEERMMENAENYIDTDKTEEIARFGKLENYNETDLRIGNGIQAFSFYRIRWSEYSIRETDEGFRASLSLDVDSHFITASVRYAPSLEAAFEILANVVFERNPW